MDETLLKELAPALGDQVLLRTFIKESADPKKKIKLSLIERLHKRMAEYKGGKAFNNVASGAQSSTLPKSNHLKRERNIEIGWMHYDQLEKEYKHVRTISGGGTRKQNVPKSWTKYDILQRAKELFFPNGVSTYIGSIDSVDIDLADYQQQPLDNTLTIESIFSITGLSKLRFYLLTQEKSPSATPHKRRRTKVSSTATLTSLALSEPEKVPSLDFDKASPRLNDCVAWGGELEQQAVTADLDTTIKGQRDILDMIVDCSNETK